MSALACAEGEGRGSDLSAAERSYLEEIDAVDRDMSESMKSLDKLLRAPHFYNAEWIDAVFEILEWHIGVCAGHRQCLGIWSSPPRLAVFHSLCREACGRVVDAGSGVVEAMHRMDEELLAAANQELKAAIEELGTTKGRWKEMLGAPTPTRTFTETPTPTRTSVPPTTTPTPTRTSVPPTTTPTPTTTPAPPTATPFLGESRANPVPRGQPALAPGGWEITVVDYIPYAWPLVAMRPINKPPSPGYRVVMVRVRVKNVDNTGEIFDWVRVRLVDSSNAEFTIFDPVCSTSSDLLMIPRGRVAESEGCFHIPSDETSLVLVVGPFLSKERLYFAVE